jgi:hypothetical protein
MSVAKSFEFVCHHHVKCVLAGVFMPNYMLNRLHGRAFCLRESRANTDQKDTTEDLVVSSLFAGIDLCIDEVASNLRIYDMSEYRAPCLRSSNL